MESQHSVSGPEAGEASFPGLIIREKKPENFEFPFATLDGLITPGERFFVRNHFPETPELDAHTWLLRVEGAVEQPLELTMDTLRQMPSRNVTATLECAGNGRVFLTPKVPGVQWEMGAVGTAEWTGVPLLDVLERAGLREGAVDVVLEVADTGEIKEEPKSPGKISFARSLPLSQARHGDVLLAWQMNGEELTRAHGYPVRAIVPGWYGVASVKWLARIVVAEERFNGYFQSADYSYWEERDGLPIQMLPVTRLEPKAQIARPAQHEVVPAGARYRVFGAAWSGDAELINVEVSADGGETWQVARLLGYAVRNAWRLWKYDWQAPKEPGSATLMARASDAEGRAQPMQRDMNSGTYMVSHVLPVEVEVR